MSGLIIELIKDELEKVERALLEAKDDEFLLGKKHGLEIALLISEAARSYE